MLFFVDTNAPYCKAEIIRGDDIDITMAERRILTLGTRTNFLTQLHSSFQVLKTELIKCCSALINSLNNYVLLRARRSCSS